MEKNEVVLHRTFSLDQDETKTRKYYPKHVVIWSSSYHEYEIYSLQIFRFQSERGGEGMEGIWTGMHNGKVEQCNYFDLFHDLKERL